MNSNISTFQYAVRYGLVLGITLIVFELLGFFLGIYTESIMSFITFSVIVAMLVIAIRKYRDQLNNGILSFGNAFLIGLFIFLSSGILLGVFRYLEYTFIPEIPEIVLLDTEEKLIDSSMSEEQIEFWSKIIPMSISPGIKAFSTIFSYGFWGAILSLIFAAIFKREANPMQTDSNK